MKSDRYTKTVLTIIAGCLLWLCARDFNPISEAMAQTDRGRDVVKVQIVSIDESPSLRWQAIPVRATDTVPVRISDRSWDR